MESLLEAVPADADRKEDWLDPELPVPLGHVLEFAHMVGCSPPEAADRLVKLGFRLQNGVVLPEAVVTDDLLILSRDLDEKPPWLNVADRVPLGHVMAVAEQTKRRPMDVAARFAELGLRLSEGTVLPERVEADVPAILSVDVNPASWLDETAPVRLSHVMRAAERTKRRPAEGAARLVALGLRVADGATQLEKIELEDLRMFSDREGMYEWLDKEAPVELCQVFQSAVFSGRPLLEVARRFREIGFTLADDVIYNHD